MSDNNKYVWVVQEDAWESHYATPSKVLGIFESYYDAQVRASEELATTEVACHVYKMLVHPQKQEESRDQEQNDDDETKGVIKQLPTELLPEDAQQRIREFHRQQEAHKQSVRDQRDQKLRDFEAAATTGVLVGESLQRLDAIEAELVEAAEKLCNLDEDVDDFYARRAVLMEERSALQAVLMDLARGHGDYDVQCAMQARFSFRTC